jgi:hypothetical protein
MRTWKFKGHLFDYLKLWLEILLLWATVRDFFTEYLHGHLETSNLLELLFDMLSVDYKML